MYFTVSAVSIILFDDSEWNSTDTIWIASLHASVDPQSVHHWISLKIPPPLLPMAPKQGGGYFLVIDFSSLDFLRCSITRGYFQGGYLQGYPVITLQKNHNREMNLRFGCTYLHFLSPHWGEIIAHIKGIPRKCVLYFRWVPKPFWRSFWGKLRLIGAPKWSGPQIRSRLFHQRKALIQ